MSRIVLCSREWSSSTGRYARSLVEYLQEVDHTNEYFILIKPEDMEKWTPQNPKFHKVACPHKDFSFAEQIGLKKQIESLKPDLVHFTMVQQPILYKGAVVTTMQDLTTLRFNNPEKNPIIFKFKQYVYGWVNKIAAKKSRLIITPTEFVKDDVINYTGINASKIRVTYEAADLITDIPEPIKGLEDTDFIMYVGRPNPHKNLPRLVEAFQVLKQTHPKLKLVLAGKFDPLYAAIKVKADAAGIHDVVFTDRISEGALRWLYNNCQAYIFPSLSEGFGLPGLEAMMHNAPVVSSNATCLPEVNGNAAHYFDPLDVNDMAQKINDVLTDVNLQAKLRAAGKKRVKDFSWKRMAQQTLQAYNDALVKNRQ